MKKTSLKFLVVAFLFSTTTCSAAQTPTVSSMAQDSNQLLLVISPKWDSYQATLQRYERNNQDEPWYLIDKIPIPVVIGKNGLAWGIDWIKQSRSTDVVKKEGDGMTPAGIYSLGTSFGFAADTKAIPSMQWIYLQLSPTTICVDDQKSPYYNQLVDSTTKPNWDRNTRGEMMLQIVPQYTWGTVVNYNTNQVKGAGSCIFMHIWTDSAHGTAGCVAMSEKEIIQILGWLNPAKKPVIALFPKDVYKNSYKKWGLPFEVI